MKVIRRSDVIFEEEYHTYTLISTGQRLTSVTTAIARHFPTFNPDRILSRMGDEKRRTKYGGMTNEQIRAMWKANNWDASSRGTDMHSRIEKYLVTGEFNPSDPELSRFIPFWWDFLERIGDGYVVTTEYLLHDKDSLLAGTSDCILVNKEGRAIILDWKRSREIKNTDEYGKGTGMFSDVNNCNHGKYCIQLNTYRTLLEKQGLTLETEDRTEIVLDKIIVDEMWIIVLRPGHVGVESYSVEKMEIDLKRLVGK
jgi:ATP-dependent exoDNAse (exonuclease V) beta subunit